MGQAQKATIDSIPLDPEFSELFDCTDVEAVGSPTQDVLDHTLEAVAEAAKDGVSLEEASKALGLHTDTIKKRLRKGTIEGFKVAEKYGERWLVSRSALPDHTPKAVTSPTPVVAHHSPAAVANPIQVQPEQLLESGADPKPDYVADSKLVSIIENQAHQLKAAGDVIMYLRSQIEEKDNQLKLLTDSQHKRGLWSRFYSWFIGARS